MFPFFDTNALDAARFLFGTEEPQVIYHPGTVTLNAFLEELDSEQAFADMGRAITEGSRNNTMSRIGANIIKWYGDTQEAKELFLQAAGQCSPPLEDAELEKIWQGKQRFYAKLCKQPGYIPPDAYNGAGPVAWETPIPFDEYDLPTFPVEALPEVVRRYVLAVAESTQTTVDMAAVEALGIPDWAGKFVGAVLRISGIAQNAANTMTEETYRTTHAELCSRFEDAQAKLAALQQQRDKMKADAIVIGGMMFELGELDVLPVAFDEKLWHGTIDHVTVHADEQVVFHFKDGKEIVTRL